MSNCPLEQLENCGSWMAGAVVAITDWEGESSDMREMLHAALDDYLDNGGELSGALTTDSLAQVMDRMRHAAKAKNYEHVGFWRNTEEDLMSEITIAAAARLLAEKCTDEQLEGLSLLGFCSGSSCCPIDDVSDVRAALLDLANKSQVGWMDWKPDSRFRLGHVIAVTPRGEYRAGPRKNDGCWEYMTPNCQCFGDHNQHICDDMTEAQAKAACEKHLKEADK